MWRNMIPSFAQCRFINQFRAKKSQSLFDFLARNRFLDFFGAEQIKRCVWVCAHTHTQTHTQLNTKKPRFFGSFWVLESRTWNLVQYHSFSSHFVPSFHPLPALVPWVWYSLNPPFFVLGFSSSNGFWNFYYNSQTLTIFQTFEGKSFLE